MFRDFYMETKLTKNYKYQTGLGMISTPELNPHTFLGRVYSHTQKQPRKHVTRPNPLRHDVANKVERAKPRLIKTVVKRRPTTIASVAAAAHLASLHNRTPSKRKADDIETIVINDDDSDSEEDYINIKCVRKAPVPAFSFSSFVDLPSSHKRKAEDIETIVISDDDDEDSDCEIDADMLPPPRPATPPLSKRQRVGEVNDNLFRSTLTPCEELRFMAHDLNNGWITKKIAREFTRHIFKEARRTEEGWIRRGVDCSPGKLIHTCLREPGLEWMFDIKLNASDDKEN